uniref:Uncharacterized protein n=1 Tax=Arundo donax TaxID=35708 RepID=A0A0A9HRH8_ARUDO
MAIRGRNASKLIQKLKRHMLCWQRKGQRKRLPKVVPFLLKVHHQLQLFGSIGTTPLLSIVATEPSSKSRSKSGSNQPSTSSLALISLQEASTPLPK